jgi:hypothetical protein
LPWFEAENPEVLGEVFQNAAPCVLRQAWLDREETDFAPAVVRTGWRDNTLLLFAELTDLDIFNRATALNQRAWELGDVLEIFLRPVEQQAYVEFQVTPENQRLQLRYPDAAAPALARSSGSLKEALVSGEAFRSRTWVRPERRKWDVYAEIPARSVCDSPQPLGGRQWHFSFSRYDYTRGRAEPVISSTSPFTLPDFHRQQEWGILTYRLCPK